MMMLTMITMTVKMMMVIMMMKMITMKEYDGDDDDDEDDFIFTAAFLLWCRPQYLREPLLYIHPHLLNWEDFYWGWLWL